MKDAKEVVTFPATVAAAKAYAATVAGNLVAERDSFMSIAQSCKAAVLKLPENLKAFRASVIEGCESGGLSERTGENTASRALRFALAIAQNPAHIGEAKKAENFREYVNGSAVGKDADKWRAAHDLAKKGAKGKKGAKHGKAASDAPRQSEKVARGIVNGWDQRGMSSLASLIAGSSTLTAAQHIALAKKHSATAERMNAAK